MNFCICVCVVLLLMLIVYMASQGHSEHICVSCQDKFCPDRPGACCGRRSGDSELERSALIVINGGNGGPRPRINKLFVCGGSPSSWQTASSGCRP